jgi:hypothetical protein
MWCVGWYTLLIRRILVRMIGFIGTFGTTSLNYTVYLYVEVCLSSRYLATL